MPNLTVLERDQLILAALDTGWWERRINPRLVYDDGCLLWPGTKTTDGYGKICLPTAVTPTDKDVLVRVHRVSLIRSLGRPLTDGCAASHLCHDAAVAEGECITSVFGPGICQHRQCANAEHLAEKTNAENIGGGSHGHAWPRTRAACLKCGAELTDENIIWNLYLKSGVRQCKLCDNLRRRRAEAVREYGYVPEWLW